MRKCIDKTETGNASAINFLLSMYPISLPFKTSKLFPCDLARIGYCLQCRRVERLVSLESRCALRGALFTASFIQQDDVDLWDDLA
jgi:hypothetical protein